MCELVIQVMPKAEPHHKLLAHKYVVGDVIVCKPDGWKWSERELTHPQWRIIRLPGLPDTALSDLTACRADRDGGLVRRRDRGVDLRELGARWKSGAVNVLTTEEATAFLAARKDKGPLYVIG